MKKIYSANSFKNADMRYDGIKLMEKAAKGILSALVPNIKGGNLTILCGVGNNGGDGWAVACFLEYENVTVIYTGEPKTKEALFYKNKYKGKSIHIDEKESFEKIRASETILDCIFGIGLERAAVGIYEKIFSAVNESRAFVVSADVPSGISADESKDFPHINADLTVCITDIKLSALHSATKNAYGKITVADIGVDMSNELPFAFLCDDELLSFLPKRIENSNKGTFGTLKTLCGSYNMTGAGILAINGALRSGVGLVKAFGDEKVLEIYKNRLTEPVFKSYSKNAFIAEKASCALIGCGIGKVYNDDLEEIFENLLCPLVIDADGINFLSQNINVLERLTKVNENVILTPHPAEMARLTGKTVFEVQENRLSLCKETSLKYNCTVVLKGSGTIICTPNETPIINTTGNSGLAKGGSGDVLAGIIAALVTQGTLPHYASAIGVYLHGLCGDRLKEKLSEFSYLPSDIPTELGKLLCEKLK